MEFLEYHQVADDVLDVVRHHCQGVGEKLGAVSRVAQSGVGLLRRRGGDRGSGDVVQVNAFEKDWRRWPHWRPTTKSCSSTMRNAGIIEFSGRIRSLVHDRR
jgi:hypothetical protein